MTSNEKSEFVRRLKCVRLPYDIGRLPSNIFDNDSSLSGVTAAQWKTFTSTCARSCLYKLMHKRNYKCLVLLSEIVIMVSSPVRVADIAKLFRLLEDHHKLFC